jgi:MerR family mercuric resistance operon transcriptional regulator
VLRTPRPARGDPERAASGFRLDPSETVRIARFIKRAQQLGFSLAEVGKLLQPRADRVSCCEEVQALAEAKIDDIEGKIRQLSALKSTLGALVRSCAAGDENRECPILEVLETA